MYLKFHTALEQYFVYRLKLSSNLFSKMGLAMNCLQRLSLNCISIYLFELSYFTAPLSMEV